MCFQTSEPYQSCIKISDHQIRKQFEGFGLAKPCINTINQAFNPCLVNQICAQPQRWLSFVNWKALTCTPQISFGISTHGSWMMLPGPIHWMQKWRQITSVSKFSPKNTEILKPSSPMSSVETFIGGGGRFFCVRDGAFLRGNVTWADFYK